MNLFLLALIDILLPILLCVFFLRSREETRSIPLLVLLITGLVSFLFFPLFLPRKHIEARLLQVNQSFPFVLLVVLIHNHLFEEFAKLLAMTMGALIHRSIRDAFSSFRGSLYYGYYIGLLYGIGEAATLTLFSLRPSLGHFFGVNMFLLFVNLSWIWERFLAIQIHGILGAYVGLAYFNLKKRNLKGFLGFFVLAILYHEFIDGILIALRYYPHFPAFGFAIRYYHYLVLPAQLVLGYAIVRLLAKGRHKNAGDNPHSCYYSTTCLS